jgi:hypothetical protein
LIVPGEYVGVVFYEAIAAVGHGVGRVEVYEVASFRSANSVFEVAFDECPTLETSAYLCNAFFVTRVEMILVAVGNIEFAIEILSVNAIERKRT